MFQTVIFDLDGTLLDTIGDLAAAGNYVCERNGWPTHETEEYKQMVGHGIPNLVEQFSPADCRSSLMLMSSLKAFSEYYGQHCMVNTKPYDGVAALLEELAERGVTMAVYSNKADEFSKTIVEHYLPGKFRLVWGKKKGIPVKPDPTGVGMVLQELQADPQQTLYVGDSDVDMQTAAAAGLAACGVTWGFRSRQELEAGAPRYLVDTVEQLRRVILEEA